MTGPTLLAFDTSAAYCAAALLLRGKVIAVCHEEMKKGQAERLMPMLEALLSEQDLTFAALDGIAVCTGPGNFTGIRIGVSAARGLALGLGKPAIGVSAFDGWAYGLPDCFSCIPAARDNIYVGKPGDDPVMVAADLSNFPKHPELSNPQVVGPMAAYVGDKLGLTVRQPERPLIEAIAHLGAERLGSTPSRPTPLYIRPADAAPPKTPAPAILT